MDETDARARLERMVAADIEPTLDADAITDLMRIAARPDGARNDPRNTSAAPVWTATTVYAAGDLVRQSSTAERWWLCLTGGTSASTTPSWPTLVYERTDWIILDGTVEWVDAGSRWRPTWNLNAAAAAGWEQKAAQVAHRFDFGADGQKFDRSQTHAMCLDMADRYRMRGTGSTSTGSR